MIHNLEIYVGFIPLGLLDSVVETDEIIYRKWYGPRIPLRLY